MQFRLSLYTLKIGNFGQKQYMTTLRAVAKHTPTRPTSVRAYTITPPPSTDAPDLQSGGGVVGAGVH